MVPNSRAMTLSGNNDGFKFVRLFCFSFRVAKYSLI